MNERERDLWPSSRKDTDDQLYEYYTYNSSYTMQRYSVQWV